MKQYTFRKFVPLFFIWLLSINNCFAQQVAAPALKCATNVSIMFNNYVRLIWTVPSNTCGGTFVSYDIYRSTSFNGPYTLVHSETNPFATTYDDALGTLSGTVYYYMVSNYTPCSGPFLHSDTLDNADPEPPVLNYVTVSSNNAVINWQPSVTPDTYGYILYKLDGGNGNYDTIYGRNNTTYTDLNAAVNTDSVSYTLASIDSCLNTGPINNFPHHTIFLTRDVDRCNNTITLNWYQYNNWQPTVQQYDVYVSVNGNPYTILQTLPPNVLSYQATGLNDGDFICFQVVAIQTSTLITSTSNELCGTLNVVQPADDLFIRNITVAAPGLVDVYYSVDPLADLASLKMERGLDSTDFTQLAIIAPPADLSLINIYSDSTALTSTLSYYYRIIATDSCGTSDTSSIGKSILLSGYAFSDGSFLVKWDASYMEHGTVTGYELYRDDGSGFNSVAAFDESVFEYRESALSGATPCYYVEGIDSMIFPNGVIDTIHSRSNVMCLNQPSQIYMPNAFAPQGKNNIFKPILNVEGVSSFSFSVFNRWGKEIFTTLDQDEGWDGRDNGNLVQQGAYAYQVVVIDDNKKRIEAKGTVLVVR